eukprot:TRINITY_DN24414_c0_g1_i1.p1 TRINITY_DN24414_c0_g1~~TRINITY_DN24414_c0_g1_i1.p1  ORF type:complete len:620 (+),score=149.11 TRINITY_DN24414_c0_g1_i1:47-1906(+)
MGSIADAASLKKIKSKGEPTPIQIVDMESSDDFEAEKEGDELENLNTAMIKTSVCRHWSRGHCKFGDDCGFAHGGNELRKPLKTALCKHFEGGRCRKGNNCGFAHGEGELGTPQPELLTIDSQEPLDPTAANLPSAEEEFPEDKILVLSCKKKVWRFCTIIDRDEATNRVRVHYDGYSNQFDEWIPRDSERLAKAGSDKSVVEQPQIGAKVVILSKRKRIWRQCTVVECNDNQMRVHYDGYNDEFDEWLDRSSDRIRHYESSQLIGKRKTTREGESKNESQPPKPSKGEILKNRLSHLVSWGKALAQRADGTPLGQIATAHADQIAKLQKELQGKKAPASSSSSQKHIPTDLYITSQHPTAAQASGHYKLTSKVVNGQPVWMCAGKAIFSSMRGAWMVGSESWIPKNNGWLSCKHQHNGKMPHHMGRNWRTYNTMKDPWEVCDAVVSSRPTADFVPSPTESYLNLDDPERLSKLEKELNALQNANLSLGEDVRRYSMSPDSASAWTPSVGSCNSPVASDRTSNVSPAWSFTPPPYDGYNPHLTIGSYRTDSQNSQPLSPPSYVASQQVRRTPDQLVQSFSSVGSGSQVMQQVVVGQPTHQITGIIPGNPARCHDPYATH